MTTGNSAAMTVSNAKMSSKLTKSDCEELEKKNKQERKKASKGLDKASDEDNSATEQKAIDGALGKIENGGMTFSSAKVVGAGQGLKGGKINGVATGCSNAKARECAGNGVVEGGTPGMRSGEESILCNEADYQHAGGGSGAHGEAKILNEMTQMAKKAGGSLKGGKVLFNVDWQYRQPDGKTYQSGMPCRLCYRMMCAAQKCGIEILLCDANNKPQPFDPDDECDKEADGDPRNDPYEKLDKRMGEHPYKGLGTV
jgi:hypothetical protein